MLEIVLIIIAGFLVAWVNILQDEISKARAELDWLTHALNKQSKRIDRLSGEVRRGREG